MKKNTRTGGTPASTSRSTTIPILIGAAALVLGLGGLAVGYNLVIVPKIDAATAAKCQTEYQSSDARSACRDGDATAAATAQKQYTALQKKKALEASCKGQYSATVAQADCVNGDTTTADAVQAAADEAEAAAEKKASEGETADNPYPAGTHASMQSTNRIDSSTVTYDEWITDFNANWRGYDEFSAPDSGEKYVAFIVHVQADDAGVDAGDVSYDASFTDSHGNVYSQADATYEAKPEMPEVTLGADQKASGIVVFEVPASVKGGVATIGDGSAFIALK